MHVLAPGLVMRIDQMAQNAEAMRSNDSVSRLVTDALGDPGVGLYFQRQLEHIFPEVLRHKQPPLNAMRLFPLDTSVSPGAKTYTQRMLEPLGVAKWISNPADDVPFSSVAASEDTFKLKEMGAAYGYSIWDILAGMMGGYRLDTEEAIATRRAIEEWQNTTFWNGDASVTIFGVLNFPYLPRHILGGPIDGTVAADTIVGMLNDFVNSIFTVSKQTERPTVLAMATTPYSYIMSTPRSTNNDTTIGQYFIKNNPFIQRIEPAHELEEAGPNDENLLIAYTPEKRTGKLVVAQPYTQLPAQERNFSFVVNCWSKIGGFSSSYPLAVAIGEVPLS